MGPAAKDFNTRTPGAAAAAAAAAAAPPPPPPPPSPPLPPPTAMWGRCGAGACGENGDGTDAGVALLPPALACDPVAAMGCSSGSVVDTVRHESANSGGTNGAVPTSSRACTMSEKVQPAHTGTHTQPHSHTGEPIHTVTDQIKGQHTIDALST